MKKGKRVQKLRKNKKEKIDGFGPDDVPKIRAALRQVWHWSWPKKLALKRATDSDGFGHCEKCKKKVAKLFVDHIKNVGDVDDGFIRRLFVPSKSLQSLCKKCHDTKTAQERKAAAKLNIGDFF